jgi:hypothetical protein
MVRQINQPNPLTGQISQATTFSLGERKLIAGILGIFFGWLGIRRNVV